MSALILTHPLHLLVWLLCYRSMTAIPGRSGGISPCLIQSVSERVTAVVPIPIGILLLIIHAHSMHPTPPELTAFPLDHTPVSRISWTQRTARKMLRYGQIKVSFCSPAPPFWMDF